MPLSSRYKIGQKNSFKISRSKIDLFLECPRCFVLDRREGVKRPSGAPFTLNVAVDHLLKKEFDIHRAKGEAHPLMKKYGIEAVPFMHENMDKWRENFVGVKYLHKDTNLEIFGAVDDIWQDNSGYLHVVDYKATAKKGEVELLDTGFHLSYKRQMEVYEWLLRGNDFQVSDEGYFVYVNGKKDKEAFDGKLEFDIKIIPYVGDDSWVEGVVYKIKETLEDAELPKRTKTCEYCNFIEAVGKF